MLENNAAITPLGRGVLPFGRIAADNFAENH